MTRVITWLAHALLVVVALAIALPQIYAMAFAPKITPTYLFYSPVLKAFVYREHHGNHDFVYKSADGQSYDRQAFETLLPFIYYKNMDIWGLLPINIDGQSFDAQTIRNNRQVFELKARDIVDRTPQIPVFALLDSDPGKAGLSFPEDVFRMADRQMEFVNVDVNRVDPNLTVRFTDALEEAGFAFPAQLVAGRQTILKPFDAGVFAIDATGTVYHVLRKGDDPVVTRTPIPADLNIRHMRVSENKQRKILAMILTVDDRLFLMTMPDYRLVELPTANYVPDEMDYKVIINPVAATATFDDGQTVHGVAMDSDFTPVASYARPMPTADETVQARVAQILFPFTLSLSQKNGAWLQWRVHWNGWLALIGIAGSLTVFATVLWRRADASWRAAAVPALLIMVTGLFGLLAILAVPKSIRANRGGRGISDQLISWII